MDEVVVRRARRGLTPFLSAVLSSSLIDSGFDSAMFCSIRRCFTVFQLCFTAFERVP